MLALPIGNDIVVEWRGLADAITGSFITDANVTFTLRDSDGKIVTGPTAMPLADADSATYRGLIEDATALVEATSLRPNYTLEVRASKPSEEGEIVGFRRIPCRAIYLAERA